MNSHLDKISSKDIAALEGVLNQFTSPSAMTLEMMDGFFAALHCCPDLVPPSEYLPQIWGDEMDDANAFENEKKANHFFSMVMSHWNNVGDRFTKDKAFFPLLDNDANCPGEQWSQGFLKGMNYAGDDWADLLHDEDNGGVVLVVMSLAYENHPDPEMRPFKEPVTDEKRQDLLVHLAASATKIYQYFADQRRLHAKQAKQSGVIRRASPKIGRNDPCRCGSGKKYKKCCASVTLH